MAASRWRPRATLGLELVLSVAPGLLVGTLAFGLVLHATGDVAAVARVYGRDGVAAGWLVLVAHCLAFGAVYAAGLVFLGRAEEGLRAALNVDFHDPIAGAVWTGLAGLGVWAGAVALAAPVVANATYGVDLPVPYPHWYSLVGLVLFGLLLGGTYPVVYERVTATPQA